MTQSVPDRAQVLVVGGGPAGATASTLLAREGFDVVCLERDHFPRYHIGESLVPSVIEILELMGAREKVERAGFVRKPGAQLDWGHERWRLDFGELSGRHLHSLQVERDEFDQVLLEHARSQGAGVFQGHSVVSLDWVDGRCRRAVWRNDERSGEIAFDVLIDASGRSGLIPTRYNRDRLYHDAFRNIALWRYWENVDQGDESFRGAIRVSSIPEGWWWLIPLRNGRTSVGLVIHKDHFKARKELSVEAVYEAAIRESGVVAEALAKARPLTDLRVESDYSYGCARSSGEGYFVCGDSACFLDPLLSTGVHLAMYSALVASAAIASALRGDFPEERCREYFETTYRKAYGRLLVLVSAFYDQNRGKRGYFWEAQKLTRADAERSDLQSAFLHVVAGMEDLQEAAVSGDAERVSAMVASKLRENLSLRQRKAHAEPPEDSAPQRAGPSDAFMDQMEGLFALAPRRGTDGLYVATTPRLRLASVS